jgi:hypothetical protein
VNTVLVAANQGDNLGWPDVIVVLGLFALIGFLSWVWFRD